MRFNVSHAYGREIGVDIERIVAIDASEILAIWASPQERAFWAATAVADRRLAFYRGWARKEALLKAKGAAFRCRHSAWRCR